jgi:hypothetical protein
MNWPVRWKRFSGNLPLKASPELSLELCVLKRLQDQFSHQMMAFRIIAKLTQIR